MIAFKLDTRKANKTISKCFTVRTAYVMHIESISEETGLPVNMIAK